MPTFLIAIGLSLIGGLGGLLVASGVLLVKDSTRSRLIPWLVSYAVGALLGVSMLALLPATLEQLPPHARSCGAAAYLNKDELSPRAVRRIWADGGDDSWRRVPAR